MNKKYKYLIDNEFVSKRTNAIYDYEFIKKLEIIPWSEWVKTPKVFRIREEYFEIYKGWIQSSNLNKISGLNSFSVSHLINGTTQTFDESYYFYKNRRLRYFRGEYGYHRRIFSNNKFIDDAPIEDNDFLIISAPFCTTGELHPLMYETLDQAYKVGAPVILDCAYFGTCIDFCFDVDHPAIESVSFSPTKGLGLGDIRSGIKFSRKDNNGSISQQNKYDHSVLAAAKIGIYMMERIGPDFIPNKYRKSQIEVCNWLNIKPAKVMHLALGDETWNDFIIDNKYYRLGIRNLVKAHFKNEINLNDIF